MNPGVTSICVFSAGYVTKYHCMFGIPPHAYPTMTGQFIFSPSVERHLFGYKINLTKSEAFPLGKTAAAQGFFHLVALQEAVNT